MSRKGWKGVERTAADLFGLTRYPANMGGRLDFGPKTVNEPPFLGQVKNPRFYSLAAITRIAEEMRDAAEYSTGRALQVGTHTTPGRTYHGVAVVKLSNKRPTPHLVVFKLDEFYKLIKVMPKGTEWATQTIEQKNMTLAKLTDLIVRHGSVVIGPRGLIVIHEDLWMKTRTLLPYDWEIGARKKEETNGREDQQESESRIGSDSTARADDSQVRPA